MDQSSIVDLNAVLTNFLAWISKNGVKIIIAIIILWIGWKVINTATKKFIQVLEKRNVDSTLRSFLNSFVAMVLKVLLLIFVMGYLGIDTTSFAALIASAGLAIGLALQGSLSNFAGGFIILLIRQIGRASCRERVYDLV